ETAQQAARALEPFAGKYASAVFAIGLLGSALVAVPVLASTSAFVISEMFGWEASLNEPFTGARPFYLTLTSTVVVALAIGYAGISPIKILFYSGVAGGIATPLTMALMILLGRDRKLMGKTPVPIWLSVAGWIATAIVTGATLIYLYQSLAGG
ncbi:MAG: divalent metal cation transporter, partial [Candidatus Eremiobacteraeota bacterium]|nr:divalent metal cation transporter [Candidatus Eremiobacteraeota bacterium]